MKAHSIGILCAMAGLAASAFGNTYYGDFSLSSAISTSSEVWTNATDSTLVAWTQGSFGVVTRPWSGGDSFSFNDTMKFGGLRWLPTAGRWCTVKDAHGIWIGEDGLDLPNGGCLGFGDTGESERLWLTAPQTWTGPADSSKRAHVAIGHDNWADFYKCKVNADGCPSWTIRQGMNVWFTWTNRLSKTAVTVVHPAKIWLEKEWDLYSVRKVGQPAIGAKSLTLSGEGTLLEAGGKSSIASGRGHEATLESELNGGTLTEDLTLDAGADILGTGAGWDIPTLKVTGAGASELKGSWTFRRARTAVSIEAGATLSLTGTSYAEATGVAAGLDVTGAGTLRIDLAAYRLTGALTLGADVKLVLTGSGEFRQPIAGGSTVEVWAGERPLVLNAAALAGYTGNVTVKAGQLVLAPVPQGVTVVEDGGTLFDVSAPSPDPWVVTDAVRPEATLTVGAGETLHVYGSGLTAATELVLAGGTVVFCRSATIASPVTVTARSGVGADSWGVTGELSGYVTSVREEKTSLDLSGEGTVNLSGGGKFERVDLFVRKGRANLTAGTFVLENADAGVYEGDYLGVRDGARVEFLHADGVYGLRAKPQYRAEAVVEVCSNATVLLNQNCTILLGGWQSWGVFRLSGGTVHIVNGTRIHVGYDTDGWGAFEINDGELNTSQSFRTFGRGSKGRIKWRGGCIRLKPQFWTYDGNEFRYLDGTSSNLTFSVEGPNCVLDLNGAAGFTNVVANAWNADSWQWTEGGRLTVTNGGTFVMNRFPENGRVAVKDCRLEIADDRVPAIGEIGFAGASPEDTVTGSVSGLSAAGVWVGPGAEWRPSQVVDIGWRSLEFATDATLLLSPTVGGTVPALVVPGKVTLGDRLVYRLDRNGNRLSASQGPLLEAADGVAGDPEFVRGPKTPKGLTFAVGATDLTYEYRPSGTRLIIR